MKNNFESMKERLKVRKFKDSEYIPPKKKNKKIPKIKIQILEEDL